MASTLLSLIPLAGFSCPAVEQAASDSDRTMSNSTSNSSFSGQDSSSTAKLFVAKQAADHLAAKLPLLEPLLPDDSYFRVGFDEHVYHTSGTLQQIIILHTSKDPIPLSSFNSIKNALRPFRVLSHSPIIPVTHQTTAETSEASPSTASHIIVDLGRTEGAEDPPDEPNLSHVASLDGEPPNSTIAESSLDSKPAHLINPGGDPNEPPASSQMAPGLPTIDFSLTTHLYFPQISASVFSQGCVAVENTETSLCQAQTVSFREFGTAAGEHSPFRLHSLRVTLDSEGEVNVFSRDYFPKATPNKDNEVCEAIADKSTQTRAFSGKFSASLTHLVSVVPTFLTELLYGSTDSKENSKTTTVKRFSTAIQGFAHDGFAWWKFMVEDTHRQKNFQLSEPELPKITFMFYSLPDHPPSVLPDHTVLKTEKFFGLDDADSNNPKILYQNFILVQEVPIPHHLKNNIAFKNNLEYPVSSADAVPLPQESRFNKDTHDSLWPL